MTVFLANAAAFTTAVTAITAEAIMTTDMTITSKAITTTAIENADDSPNSGVNELLMILSEMQAFPLLIIFSAQYKKKQRSDKYQQFLRFYILF
jgi:uncharacterized protein involved in propanediol utilization